MPSRQLIVCLVASILSLAACGGGDDKAEDATSTTTTTAAVAPAPAAPADVSPLTGLPQPDGGRRARPALVVKIDNAPIGRPQTGFNQADVVVVEKVEGHITRLFAVFQSNDADPVGPVRSARSTDVALLMALNRPLFAYAGTNAAFQALVDKAPVVDVGYNKAAGEFKRTAGRPAPYNLFTNTSALFRRAAPDAAAPPALFTYRPAGAEATGDPAGGVHVEYRAGRRVTTVDYAWDAGSGSWKRTQDGTPFVDTAGTQAAPANVVVQFVEYRDTGQRDPSGAVVDEGQLVGRGEAWVLTGGRVVKGTWSKPAPEAVTVYADGAGQPVALAPGTTWVELAPPGAAGLT